MSAIARRRAREPRGGLRLGRRLVPGRVPGRRRAAAAGATTARSRGFAAVESLLALPVLLFVGFGALQLGLVYQARHALGLALHEAARAGSVAHADGDAIRDGLARGMLPWLYGAADAAEFAANLVRARAHVAQAEARGWLRLERQSPTAASFDDWAEPARDAFGETLDGVREIPNDDLVHRAIRTLPAGGTAGLRSGEPIGAASGQTLLDANLLRLRMTYAVPLSVPVAGRLIAWSLRTWHGCAAGAGRTWGVLRLDAPPRGPASDPEACAMLGLDDGGVARLPVSASATVRMQTPARDAGSAAPLASRPGAEAPPARTGTGPASPASDATGSPAPIASTPPAGGAAASTSPTRAEPGADPRTPRTGDPSPPPSASRPPGEPMPADPAFCGTPVG